MLEAKDKKGTTTKGIIAGGSRDFLVEVFKPSLLK